MSTFAEDLRKEQEQLRRRFIHHTRPKGPLLMEEAVRLSHRMSITDHAYEPGAYGVCRRCGNERREH